MIFMPMKRIPLFLELTMLRDLMRLAAKIGSDRAGAIRYCIARTLEAEGITREGAYRPEKPER
jgi:hypothetical protein